MTIKRIIDGRVYEFELTESELYAAVAEADRKEIKDCVETELKYWKDSGRIPADVYDRLVPMVDDIADEVTLDLFDSDVLCDIRWDIINSRVNDHAARVLIRGVY